MLKKSRFYHRGDTLVEVLFAVAVFSLVAVGGMSVMNAGLSTVQRSLEQTLAREEMDSQAEVIRFMHDSYITAYPNIITGTPADEWQKIINNQVVDSASKLDECTDITNPFKIPNKSFVVNTKTAKIDSTTPISSDVPSYSQLRYSPTSPVPAPPAPPSTTSVISAVEGIWVEAVKSNSSNKFIDFHIRACWDSAGSNVPVTLGTIVRLYEP